MDMISRVRMMMADEFSVDQINRVEQIIIRAMQDDRELPSTDIDRTENVIKQFLGTKKLQGCKASTLKAYRHTLNKMYSFTFSLVDASTDDIRYFLAMMASSNSALSLDNHRRYLSSFYKWAYREGIILSNPMDRIDRVKIEKVIKLAFQSTEIEKFKEVADTLEEKAVLYFLLSTGVRCSELISIPLSRVDFRTREVVVMGKGAKERKVYMNGACYVHLTRYLDDRHARGIISDWLFISSRKVGGKYVRMPSKKAEQMVRGFGERTGIDNVHIHRFRRHFCTHLIKLGCSLVTIQKLMGHESISTTQHYISVSDDAVKEEFIKLGGEL